MHKSVDHKTNRIAAVDVLRGFALAGILYTHLTIWFTGSALPREFYQQFDDFTSQLAMAIFGVLFLGKFYTIFSFLFGFSFHQQASKNTRASYYNRILVLGLLGLLHHLLWSGDILLIYAMLALTLPMFNKISDRNLLIVALIFSFNIPGQVLNLTVLSHLVHESSLPMSGASYGQLHMIASGTFNEIVDFNANILASKIIFQCTSGRLFITLGFFLLGIYVARKNLIKKASDSILKSTRLITFCIAMILLSAAGVLVLIGVVEFPALTYPMTYRWLLKLMFDTYNFCLTLCYISTFLLVYRGKPELVNGLEYAGRMPLTIYITQTIIGIFLFYNVGLGLLKFTTPAMNALMVVPIFIFQLWLSKYWLSKFEYGPMEWLWRCLAESRWIRFRKRMLS